jgi:hypothetical protein
LHRAQPAIGLDSVCASAYGIPPVPLGSMDQGGSGKGVRFVSKRDADLLKMHAGDVVMTRVPDHSSLGRISADGQTQTSELGTVAMFSASDDTIAMMQALLIEAAADQSLISCPLADIKQGITDFRKYLEGHNPEVVIFDISPPYNENWAVFTTIRDDAVMRGRGVVLTTTSKAHLDELNGEETYACEVVGGVVNRALLLAEIKAATRLARTARRQNSAPSPGG